MSREKESRENASRELSIERVEGSVERERE